MLDVKRTLRPSTFVALAALLVTAVVVRPAGAASVTATPVATGLAFPAAFTFTPDGTIFYGERFTGQIRIINPSTGANTLFFTVPDLVTTGSQGLLGLAADPDYPTKPFVYAYTSRTTTSGPHNQILRLTSSGGIGSRMKIIYQAQSANAHNGGRILFGPSKRLFVIVGEGGTPANAQDLTTTRGKVLRMTRSGAAPANNPYSESLVWAYGIRNSFGFTFDPQTNMLWETENGPACNDELNLIVKGRNYGWGPSQTCASPPPPPTNTNQDGANPVLPKRFYTPQVAPTGAAFCSACGLGTGSEGHLFYGTFNTREVREVTLNAERKAVVAENVAYTHAAAILSMERAPSGALYFSDESGIYRLTVA